MLKAFASIETKFNYKIRKTLHMKKLIVLFAFLLSITIFAQSPWTKDKGDIFAQFSFTTISNYDKIFGDPDYNIVGKISDRTYQIYSEYGLTGKTSLLVNIPFKAIRFKKQNTINCITAPCPSNDFDKNESSFGNIELGVKHQFYNDGWVIAGQLSAALNTSSYHTNGIRTGYDAYTFTPLFIAGKSFGNTYLQTHIGAQIRTNNYSSNFKFGAEYGGKIFTNFWLIGYVDIVKSLENGAVILPPNNLATALYINNQEFGTYGLKTIWQFCDLGLTAGFGSAFYGNNVPKKAAFTIGIFNTF